MQSVKAFMCVMTFQLVLRIQKKTEVIDQLTGLLSVRDAVCKTGQAWRPQTFLDELYDRRFTAQSTHEDEEPHASEVKNNRIWAVVRLW